MIGIVDVEIQAANPSMPLYPMRAFVGSPSSIRVRNVPKKIGNWQITSVQFTAAYPDSSIKTANCVLVGGVWVGTIAGCSVSGQSINGYSVFASGTDENRNAVENYCLGKGDITILEADGTITPGEDTHYLHLLDAQPTNPKEGDVYKASNGEYNVYQNNIWNSLGTALTEEQISAINSVVDERQTVVKFNNNETHYYDVAGELTIAIRQGWETGVGSTVKEVKIGKGVTSIRNAVFSYCTELTSVTIPNSVASIGSYTFNYCSGLTSMTIPGSVTSIGFSVFFGCTQLSSIIVVSKNQAQAEALLANAGVSPSIITTWNDASQEWVADNYATNTYANSISALAQSASDKANQIDDKIPAQTWNTGNELADKAFVNSSVQTATANFRGNWSTWNDVPSVSSDYPEDYAGSKVPTVNDYLVVQDASDLSSTYEGTWRFKYSGTWADDGKNGWLPEYQVNETPMTAAQLAALNSGITAQKVLSIDTIPTSADYVALVPNSYNGQKNAVTIGTRKNGSYVGIDSFSIGTNNVAVGQGAFVVGQEVSATYQYGSSYAIGTLAKAAGDSSFALGWNAYANDDMSFVWNSDDFNDYSSKGIRTFCVNPKDGLSGFYIGEQSLGQIIGDVETLINAL